MSESVIVRYSRDIRFWILVFFLLRLYGIWFPPYELTHNWRQTTVAMVARNFLESDANLFYPRIDIAGEKTGITGMEFPLLNHLTYLLSLLFGYQHWYGRIIVLVVSSLGIWSFFRLCQKFFKHEIAFNATIVLLFSIWFTYSRKIMPDTFSMSLVFFGLWQGLLYLENRAWKHLLAYTVLMTAGILSKLPSAYMLSLMALPLLARTAGKKHYGGIIAGSGLALTCAAFWYFYWVPHLNQTFGFEHFFMGKSMSEGGSELLNHWQETLSKFYDVAIKYIAFAFFILGISMAIRRREKALLAVFLTGFVSFLPIMLKGGFTFYHHSYYIIPFVPILALLSGYGISCLPKANYKRIVLLAIATEGLLNHMDDFRIKPEYKALSGLEARMDSLSDRNDLILVNSGAFPTPVYFAHRKGWVAFNEQIQRKQFTDSLAGKGLAYILIMKRVFGQDLILPYKELYNSADFRIYSLKETPQDLRNTLP